MEVTLGRTMSLCDMLNEPDEVFVLSLADRDALRDEFQYLYAIKEQTKALLKSIGDKDDKPPEALKHLRWLLEVARAYH